MDQLLAVVIVFFGALVQSAFGFGIAVLGAPLLILISTDYIPGPLTLSALVQSAMMMWVNRSGIDYKPLKAAFIARIPGSIAGVWLLTLLSPQTLSIAIGVLVVISVIISLAKFPIQPTPKAYFVGSFFSGLFGPSTSIGGPPIALVLQNETGLRIRANLGAYFTFGCMVTMVLLVITGQFTQHHLEISIPLLPAAVLGVLAARTLPLEKWDGIMKPAILVLCSVSAMIAIVKGIMG